MSALKCHTRGSESMSNTNDLTPAEERALAKATAAMRVIATESAQDGLQRAGESAASEVRSILTNATTPPPPA